MIVIPAPIPITAGAKQQIARLGASVYEDRPRHVKEMLARVREAEVIVGNYNYKITQTFIDALPKLKYIIAPTVGYEWIDYAYAAKRGIKVLNCPTHNYRAVAEHAIALLFAVKRKVVEAALTLRAGSWDHSELTGTEIRGKKLGLVGYGRIGKQIGVLAKGISMEVAYVNTASTDQIIDELLQTSDVICLCLPLTDKTHHIVDERRLSLLQPQAILLNVGRGATVNQKALTKVLQENRIAGAGLDVFEGEPLGPGKPPSKQMMTLAHLPNVVATPLIGFKTIETSERLGTELLANIKACLANKPINVIN